MSETPEMVERVARAICLASGDGPPDRLTSALPNRAIARWQMYEHQARAAIEEIRNPTPEMVRVGVDDILEGPGIGAFRNWPDLVESRHRMMIDAALATPAPERTR